MSSQLDIKSKHSHDHNKPIRILIRSHSNEENEYSLVEKTQQLHPKSLKSSPSVLSSCLEKESLLQVNTYLSNNPSSPLRERSINNGAITTEWKDKQRKEQSPVDIEDMEDEKQEREYDDLNSFQNYEEKGDNSEDQDEQEEGEEKESSSYQLNQNNLQNIENSEIISEKQQIQINQFHPLLPLENSTLSRQVTAQLTVSNENSLIQQLISIPLPESIYLSYSQTLPTPLITQHSTYLFSLPTDVEMVMQMTSTQVLSQMPLFTLIENSKKSEFEISITQDTIENHLEISKIEQSQIQIENSQIQQNPLDNQSQFLELKVPNEIKQEQKVEVEEEKTLKDDNYEEEKSFGNALEEVLSEAVSTEVKENENIQQDQKEKVKVEKQLIEEIVQLVIKVVEKSESKREEVEESSIENKITLDDTQINEEEEVQNEPTENSEIKNQLDNACDSKVDEENQVEQIEKEPAQEEILGGEQQQLKLSEEIIAPQIQVEVTNNEENVKSPDQNEEYNIKISQESKEDNDIDISLLEQAAMSIANYQRDEQEEEYLEKEVQKLIDEVSSQLGVQQYTKNMSEAEIEEFNKMICNISIPTQEEEEAEAKMREQSVDKLISYSKTLNEAKEYLDSLSQRMEREQKILKDIQNANRQIEQYTNNNNKKQQFQQQQQHQQQLVHVKDVLSLSIDSIKFGVVFPGNVFEDQVEITNKTSETIPIKAVGLCLNPEFDSHGEYVYSIRKVVNYDYNEKLTLCIPPNSSAKIFVALKVPNIHNPTLLKGSFAVTVTGLDTYISIPISAQVEIPNVVCTRQLFHSTSDFKVIRLAIRKSKKSDCKIPFKNISNHSLLLQPEWLDEKPVTNLPNNQPCPFNILIQPVQFTVPPKGLFMMQCLLRPNQNLKEFNDRRLATNDKSPLLIKNILLLKVSNSSIIMHFPLSLEVTL